MRVFKTKWFIRFARRERINESALLEAIERTNRGLVDADLGGHLIKQRVARAGKGRSGGYRTIIAYRKANFAVFIFGFAKSDIDNLAPVEEASYKDAAADYATLTSKDFDILVQEGLLAEIDDDA